MNKTETMHTNTHKQEKAKISLTIDKEVYENAHKLGLNVSKVAENALKTCTEALETRSNQNLSLAGVSFRKEKAIGAGMGIEPIYNSSAGK